MGGLYSRLTRPIRTFNIQNRAERIISQDKPTRAPQYESTEKQKKMTDEVYPGFLEKHYQKNIQLDQRLKDVFVTSADSQKITSETESKPLPQNRRIVDEFNMHYYEPTVIPEGKCTLRQAYKFMSQHKKDPIEYNIENIAAEYKIDKNVIGNILKHFKIYVSMVPGTPDQPEQDPFQDQIDESYKEYKKVMQSEKEKE